MSGELRVVTTRRADEDVDRAVDRYRGEAGAEVADRLVSALEDTFDLMARFPFVGDSRFAADTGIPDLRSLVLGRFPYVVLYTVEGETARVHRVLHLRRDIPAELRS